MDDIEKDNIQTGKRTGPDKQAHKEEREMLVREFERDVVIVLNRVFDNKSSPLKKTEFRFKGPEGRFSFTVAAMPSGRREDGQRIDERLFTRLDSYDDKFSSTTRIAIKNSGYVFVGDLVRQSFQELLRGKLNNKAITQISGIVIEPLGFPSLMDKEAERVDVGEIYDRERDRRLKPIEIEDAFGRTIKLQEIDRSKVQRETVLDVLKSSGGRAFAVSDGKSENVAIVDMSLAWD